MTAPAYLPPPPQVETRLSARTILGQAFRMVRDHPREAMLPLIVLQVPAAAIGAIITAVLYFTAFSDEEFAATEGGPLLALLLISAFEGLFAQVARAATIVSIAGVATGKPKSLTDSLDPAFTRMGPLLGLVLILVAGFSLGVLTIIGLILLPYVVLRVAVSFEAFILEDLGPMAAIRRAWSLTRGNMLRLLALVLLTALVIAAPLLGIQSLALIDTGGRTSDVLLGSFLSFAQGVLLLPIVAFLTASTTLFYLNLVGRNNG